MPAREAGPARDADDMAPVTLAQILNDFGYAAVLAGSLLEGETLLMLAGFAAQRGYLSLSAVIGVAFMGGLLGDQFYFFIGRRYGARLLRRFPRLAGPARLVTRQLMRFHEGLIVGVRFMYGVRILGPIVIGMSGVPARRFLAFNALGAALWATSVAGVGYLFGDVLQQWLGEVERYEMLVLLGGACAGALIAGWRWWRAISR
jgi:membrane protein DedA with SNARE-associated domain